METVDAVNTNRKRGMARKVVQALSGDIHGKTIAVLGLTFKPNTDDMREAPSIALISALTDQGAIVRGFDPAGMAQAKLVMPDITYAPDAYVCADGADALVIATEWDAFRALDLGRMKTLLNTPLIIDLRNIYRL